MARLLLTGNGTLFENLAAQWSADTDVVAITTNADEPRAAVELVGELHPDKVVHCGGLCTSAWDCATSINWSDEAESANLLAAAAAQAGAAILFFSSDAVFAGPRIFHEEDSPINDTCAVSIARCQIEQAILHQAPDALILRTHSYGWSRHNASFAQKSYEALSQGIPIVVDGTSHSTPILASDLAAIVERAFRHHLHGLYHCSGAERTNQFRFAEELAMIAGFDRQLIRTIKPPAIEDSIAPVHCPETSLNCRQARRALAMPLPLLRAGLSRFVEQNTNGYRATLGVSQRVVQLAA
ncbi:MAG: sugar nucleotide-binding protein [Planctomycetota bacterium]|nr:sugar nucleotide-binding protein [Planctomycetota bacterium]